MPRLIVLNGPPGCGKSTLAEMYVDANPLALNLDIDRLRSMIGHWGTDLRSSGLLARAVAIAAARTHLTSGNDVIIPQFLGRPEFLEEIEHLASEVAAEFHEIVLLDTQENAARRFDTRTQAALHPSHIEAHELLVREGGPDELSTMYNRLLSIIASRPTATVVPTRSGQVDEAFRDLLSALSENLASR